MSAIRRPPHRAAVDMFFYQDDLQSPFNRMVLVDVLNIATTETVQTLQFAVGCQCLWLDTICSLAIIKNRISGGFHILHTSQGLLEGPWKTTLRPQKLRQRLHFRGGAWRVAQSHRGPCCPGSPKPPAPPGIVPSGRHMPCVSKVLGAPKRIPTAQDGNER